MDPTFEAARRWRAVSGGDADMDGAAGSAFQRENQYLNRAALSLIAVAVLAFALFNLSGAADITQMALITHAHVVIMSAWLGLVAVETVRGSRGAIALHRRIGQAGAGLAVLVAATGLMTVHHTLVAGRVRAFFTPG